MYAWGSHKAGQLGTGSKPNDGSSTPLKVATLGGGSPVVRVAAGAEFSMAVNEEGQLGAWGESHSLLSTGCGFPCRPVLLLGAVGYPSGTFVAGSGGCVEALSAGLAFASAVSGGASKKRIHLTKSSFVHQATRCTGSLATARTASSLSAREPSPTTTSTVGDPRSRSDPPSAASGVQLGRRRACCGFASAHTACPAPRRLPPTRQRSLRSRRRKTPTR